MQSIKLRVVQLGISLTNLTMRCVTDVLGVFTSSPHTLHECQHRSNTLFLSLSQNSYGFTCRSLYYNSNTKHSTHCKLPGTSDLRNISKSSSNSNRSSSISNLGSSSNRSSGSGLRISQVVDVPARPTRNAHNHRSHQQSLGAARR